MSIILQLEEATLEQLEVNLLAADQPKPIQPADQKQLLAMQGAVALIGAQTADAVLQSQDASASNSIYFSEAINKLIEQASAERAAAVEKQAAQFKAFGITWPINPNYKDKMNPYDVPLNYDSLMTKIRLYLSAMNANPRDTTLLTSFLVFMANIQKTVAVSDPNLMKKIMPELNRIANISGNKMSFTDMIASYMQQAFFFQQGGGADACRQGMKALVDFLGPLAKGNPFLSKMLQSAQKYQGSTDKFITDNTDAKTGKPKYTPEVFWWKAQGDGGKFFRTDCNAGGVAKQMLLDMIDELMQKFKRNQNLLIQVMMNTFGGHMDQKLQGLAAYGDLSKDLTGITKQIQDISSKLQDPKLTPDKAKALFEELQKLRTQVSSQDMFFGSIGASLERFFADIGKIEGRNIEGSTKISIDELLKKLQSPDLKPEDAQKIWTQIGNGISFVMNGSSGSTTPSPLYTQILGDMQALDKAATSQTSIIQTAQGVDQQQVNTCKSAWDDCSKKLMDWIHAIVQNYQRASS